MTLPNLGRFEPPQMLTPPYWVASPDEVKVSLTRSGAAFQMIGTSAGGRDLHGVVVGPDSPALTFGVIGGTHGHESGGTSAVINLLMAATQGRDLIGNPAAAIVAKVRWVLIPLLNPDGRLRCCNSFVGLTADTVNHYCNGWDDTGALLKRQNRLPALPPVVNLGGLYNDAGVDILNATDGTLEGTDAVEVAAAARFFKANGCDLVMDFHAHAFSFSFYTPIANIPKSVSDAGFEMAEKARAEATQAGVAFAAPECVASGKPCDVNVPAEALYHRVSGAIPFLLEGPQGTVGSYRAFYGGREQTIKDPGYSHRQIIEGYLFTLLSLARQFSEGQGAGRK